MALPFNVARMFPTTTPQGTRGLCGTSCLSKLTQSSQRVSCITASMDLLVVLAMILIAIYQDKYLPRKCNDSALARLAVGVPNGRSYLDLMAGTVFEDGSFETPGEVCVKMMWLWFSVIATGQVYQGNAIGVVYGSSQADKV